MTTITKERLQEIADHPKNALNATMQEVVQMARMLLASMDSAQEPVATAHRLVNKRNGQEHHWVYSPGNIEASEGDVFRVEVLKLYAAPQPLTDAERAGMEELKAKLKAAQAHITELEAAPPAPPAPVGPGEEAVAVMPDFPGRVMTQRECWQAGKEAGLAEARNSPVIPDGWVDCTDRLPEETNDADGGATGYLVLYADGKEPNAGFKVGVWNVVYLRRWWCGFITHWMPLPAAPQQEVK